MTEKPITFADVAAGVGDAIARYAQALDDGRTDDVVATFCSDGVVDMIGLGHCEGHTELREAYARVVPQRPQRHMITNTVITGWSDNEATAVSDLVFVRLGDAGWAVQLVGRYDDTFHCHDGVWTVHRRTMSVVGAGS